MIIWKQAPVVQKLDNAIHRRSLSTGKRKFIINNNYKFGGGGVGNDLDDYMETGPTCSKVG